MSKQMIKLLSLILALVFAVAACTTPEPTSDPSPTDAPVEEPTAEPEVEAVEEDAEVMEEDVMQEEAMEEMAPTIAEIATDAGGFETLLAALTAADLAGTFADAEAGPFTVFAPTDDAFAALPEGTLDTLLEDPTGALTDILTYHVVEGAVMAEDVVTLDAATMLNGGDITIEVVDGGVVLNGAINVVTTDLAASNGVIHVIDAVLLPPSDDAMEEDAMMDEEMMEDESAMLGTIAEVATEAGGFETLLTALTEAGLAETFADAEAGPFTVFAPTDEAFAALPEGTLDTLLEDPSGALTNILTYHVVEGAVMAEDVVMLDAATTLNGTDISIAIVDDGVVLNETVNVIATDIETSNGVIHVIDAVLLPHSDDAMMDEDETMMDEDDAMMDEAMMLPSIAEVATEAGSFGTLLTALTEAGLAETFADAEAGPFTVFAPTDEAFAALPEGLLDTLLADPEGALSSILTYHVVEGEVLAEAVMMLDSAETLNGQSVTIEIVDDGVVLNGSVNVVTTDIMASNGVIHVIDAVLVPAEDDAAMMEESMDGDESMMEEALSIAELAAADGRFTILLTALTEAGLADTFTDAEAGPFTVLAPTDDAFAALPEGTLETLLADPEGALTNILTYHVIEGAVMSETVVTLEMATTLNGSDIQIAVVDGGVVLNDTVNVIITDLEASNGVIHVIDSVLIPVE
ncbi:MAG: fasciclin domain-containing protein [Candidatus Promineifilaceae bacterium]